MAYTKDEYYAVLDKASKLTQKLLQVTYDKVTLEEEIEILRAERSHWYHMYNNNVDVRPDI